MFQRRKNKIGIVLSRKMDKTAIVIVERRVQDPKYKKYITKRSKYKVHDEKNESNAGDKVLIKESKPISKEKSWKLISVLQKSSEDNLLRVRDDSN
jgi:small subunit ribosomal protein S17